MSWSQVPTFIRDDKQRILVNPAKQFIQPFELPIDAPNQIITIAAGARAGPFPMTARYDGGMEVFYVKVRVADAQAADVTTYNIRWFLEHPGKRIQFMPVPISLLACSGDAGRPYVLPETIYIPPVQSLNVTFFNDDLVNARQVELVFGCVKFYPQSAPEKLRKEMLEYTERRERTYTYWTTTNNGAITLTASLLDFSAFVTVPDDADLEIYKLTAQSTGVFRVRIRDSQNDRALTGAKIHSSLLFGGHHADALAGIGGSGGIFPARWPTTWLVRRSLQYQLDFDNLIASPNTIHAIFGGRKISYA